MATSSQAAPATAAATGSDRASNTSETIVGSHVFTIHSFSATIDLDVGKCIKSSTFRVGGHGWYIQCFPCGDVEDRAGWVSLFLCRQEYQPGSRVLGECEFTLMESLKDGNFSKLIRYPILIEFEDDEIRAGTDIIKTEELESLLKDDCFHVRCVVFIQKFTAAPMPDMATEIVDGSHVLTIDNGYSNIRRAFDINEVIKSSNFCVGGYSWHFTFCPWDEEDRIGVYLFLGDDDDEVKVRLEISLLTHAGQIISSIQDFSTFAERTNPYGSTFLPDMEHESSPLVQHGIQIRCDIAFVKGITVVQAPPERPDLHRHLGNLLASKVGTDVTFEVGGELFSAHKSMLATRSTVFMAEFFGFGPAGKENAGVSQVLHIDDMDPRVFRALLHFIYTDALPEVHEEEKVMMAQGLLVAADRYAMERLKLICGDMLCTCIDATNAVATRELADNHGCLKLKEVCIKVIREWLAKVTP